MISVSKTRHTSLRSGVFDCKCNGMRCLLHILNEFVIGYICSSHFTQTETDTCIRPVSDTGVVMPCPPSPRRRRAGAGAGRRPSTQMAGWRWSRCGIRHACCVDVDVVLAWTRCRRRRAMHIASSLPDLVVVVAVVWYGGEGRGCGWRCVWLWWRRHCRVVVVVVVVAL